MKTQKTVLVLSFMLCCISFPLFAASDLESGVKDLAQQISKNMVDNNKKKIAVIEFSDLNDEITHFGQFLSEELITNLFLVSPGQFEVVERRQLVKVLNEHDLGTSGLLDADAMGKVGKILGVDAIVTGSVTDLGNNVKINARLISVDSAKIFAVAQTSVAKVGTVADLMKKMVVSSSRNHSQINGDSVNSAGDNTIATDAELSKSLTLDGFKFDLEKCEKTNTKVDCFFTILALEKDNFLTLYGVHRKGLVSRVYDDKGLENNAKLITLGAKSNGQYLQRTLIANVPTKAKITFDGVSLKAGKIALLSLMYHSKNNNQYGTAEFRDVAFLSK